MVDFLVITTRSTKRGIIEIYPKFIIKKSADLMIRGGDFYAIWCEEESPLHLIGHLYLFMDGLVRSSTSAQIGKGNRLRDFYIKESIAFIEENFQNDISVEDIAAACGLNRSYFGKIFHENMGKTPQEFLISYRMTKATELLKLTELSIADIGNVVGYPNQLHFSRAFKNVYQVSPRQWRIEHGGGKKGTAGMAGDKLQNQ